MRLCCDKAWALTGTPVQNNISDLWSLVEFVEFTDHQQKQVLKDLFERIGRHLAAYVRRMKRAGPNLYRVPRHVDLSPVRRVLAEMMLRRTKNTLVDGKPIITLPKLHLENTIIELSEDWLKRYKIVYSLAQNLFQDIIVNTEKKIVVFARVLKLITRLRQFVDHPFIALRSEHFEEDKHSKFWNLRQYERVLHDHWDDPHIDELFIQRRSLFGIKSDSSLFFHNACLYFDDFDFFLPLFFGLV